MKSIFESWEIKDLIGKGNFGAVYEIEKDGEKEAMKVVNIYPSNSDFNEILGVDNHAELEEKTSLVMKEIDMLYHLKGNTHIVNYIDHYVDKKEDVYSLYLKMEYLQRLDNYYGKEIESDKALSITYDILDALTICEDNNIVHGDIKPQNIMVDNHGNNKLTDFGISKIMCQEKINNYTPAYAAPEIITDGRYTKQSDLYSLGLVIYQIYNNNLLPFMKNNFEKKDTAKIIEKRLNKEVPAPTNGSKELNEFLSKALNRNPEERFQSAKAMKDELQRLDNNSLLPKVMVALPVMMAVAIKMNSFSVLAAELAKEGVKRTFVDTITSMSLTTKVIAGVVGCMIVGGGAYMGITANNVKEITTPLYENKLNILHVGDVVEYGTDPKKVDVKISFSNPELSYKDGIVAKTDTIQTVSNNGEANVKVNGEKVYLFGNVYHRTPFVQSIDLKTQKTIYKQEIATLPDIKETYVSENGEFVVKDYSSIAFSQDGKTQTDIPSNGGTENVDSINKQIGGLKYYPSKNTLSNTGKWELSLNGAKLNNVSQDLTNYTVCVSAKSGSIIDTKNSSIKVEQDGDYIVTVNSSGELESQMMTLDLAKAEKQNISSFNGYTFASEAGGEKSVKYIYDDTGKKVEKIDMLNSDNRMTDISEIFRIDENTLGYCYTLNDYTNYNKRGVLLNKIMLTDIIIEAGNKKIVRKALILPNQDEITQKELKLESMLNIGHGKDSYYGSFMYFVPFLSGYSRKSDNTGTIGKEDFKTELAQRYFLSSARWILDIESDGRNMPDGWYKLKTKDCIKAVKDYLGVEPAFDTSNEYYQFEGIYSFDFNKISPQVYQNKYFSDQMYKCTQTLDGEYTTIKFYSPGDGTDFLLCSMKIKGNINTYNFTFDSASDVFVD